MCPLRQTRFSTAHLNYIHIIFIPDLVKEKWSLFLLMYSNFNKHTLVNEIRQNPVVLETIIYPVNNKKSS